ncbi:MAG: Co2+/Mg2+ efflux protein ApaG [Gammaproteobacteria bacterium]|nr:Co2+/Mg2+ efflux protein ApaG [Gammaproteobacteria bacterium]
MDDNGHIEVKVKSMYVEEHSQPDDERFVFAYTVTIRNTGKTAAQLLTRHWIITDGHGREQEVRGEGVVGEQPYLKPGEEFRYTSGTVLETPVGSMHGRYRMRTDDGSEFDAQIAPFTLSTPRILH